MKTYNNFEKIRRNLLGSVKVIPQSMIFSLQDKKCFHFLAKELYRLTEEILREGHFQGKNYSGKLEEFWKYYVFRADIIYQNPKNYKVIELNFGDPSGAGVMEATYRCYESLNENISSYGRDHTAEKILEACLDFYRTYFSKTESPVIFLAMPEKASVYYDFEILLKLWRRRVNCVLGDPKDLVFDERKLKFVYGNYDIDLIYRDEFFDLTDLANKGLLLQSIRKAREYFDFLPIFNPLESRYLDSKKHLCEYFKKSSDIFAPTYCTPWTDQKKNQYSEDKDQWVLKPYTGYGGKGVHIGKFTKKKLWDKILNSRGEYVIQKYYPLPKYKLKTLKKNDLLLDSYHTLLSLWVIGGEFSGNCIRVSSTPVVNVHQSCSFVPAYYEVL